MGSRLFRGNGHFALVMLSPSASDPPRHQVSEQLPVPIYSSNNRGVNLDTSQLFTDAIIQIDEMTERNDIQLFTECDSQQRRSYIDPKNEVNLNIVRKLYKNKRQLTRLCPAIYQTRETKKYVIQQFYSATCYNAVILMLLLDACDIGDPRVRQFAEHLASFKGYSSWEHMYKGKSIMNFGDLVLPEYTDIACIQTEMHNLHDSGINKFLPMIAIIEPGHFIILDEVTDSGYRIRDPWHGHSLLLRKDWFDKQVIPSSEGDFNLHFARMYTLLEGLVVRLTPIKYLGAILVITKGRLEQLESFAGQLYTLTTTDSRYTATSRFDLRRVTRESLEVVRSRLRPRFSEIYFNESIYDFTDWNKATHLINLLVLLLEPAGRMFIPFGTGRDQIAKACAAADQTVIATCQNAQPEDVGRSSIFGVLFPSHNNVMEIERQVPKRTETGILRTYSEMNTWLERVRIYPAYLIIGVTPGEDGLYLPELLLEDEHVFTWNEYRCESVTHPAANDRFLHFKLNTATSLISCDKIHRGKGSIFDEIIFDWPALKFVERNVFPFLVKLFYGLIMPGGFLLTPYSDRFNFKGGIVPVKVGADVEEASEHDDEITQFIMGELDAAGFGVLIYDRSQFSASVIFTTLMTKNEAIIRSETHQERNSKIGDAVIVAIKQERQKDIKERFMARFPTDTYSVTGTIDNYHRDELNIFQGQQESIGEGLDYVPIVSIGNYVLKQGLHELVTIRYSYIYDTGVRSQKPCINLQEITNHTRGTETRVKGIGMLFVLYTLPIFVADINGKLESIRQLSFEARTKRKLPDRVPFPFREDIAVYLHAAPLGGESLLEYYKTAGFVEMGKGTRLMKGVYSTLVATYLTPNKL
jgi:hypothetical protein